MTRTVGVYFIAAILFLFVNIAVTIGSINISNTPKIEYGIHTCSENHCVSDLNNRIYLSLFVKQHKYQCHIFPIDTDHWYTCDTSDMYTLNCNGTYLELDNGIYLLVSNEGDNGIHFDQIMINIQDSNTNYSVTIDTFTMSNSEFNQLQESMFTEYQIGTDTYKAIPVAVTNILIHMEHNNTANVSAFQNKTQICIEETEDKYIYVNQPRNWFEAEKYCLDNYDTHLATILSEKDMMRVRLLTGPGIEAWFGLTDFGHEGFWEFSDGTLCNGKSCANIDLWVFGEPNNYNGTSRTGENCAHISHDVNGFNDKKCSTPQRFICKWGVKNTFNNDWSNWIIGGVGVGGVVALCFTICGIIQVCKNRKLQQEKIELQKEKIELQNEKIELQNELNELSSTYATKATTTYDHRDSSSFDK